MRGPPRKYDSDSVLALYAAGLSEVEVAQKLSIPRATVNRYVKAAGIGRPRAQSILRTNPDGAILKLCLKCGQWKPATRDFFRAKKGGHCGFEAQCLACLHDRWKDRFASHKETERLRVKAWARNLRHEVIAHYSNESFVCACCGENHVEFLAIDHINGGGNAHRRSINRGGISVYRCLQQQGYPEGFQVLCHNCNFAKFAYGQCPHQKDLRTQGKLLGECPRESAGL